MTKRATRLVQLWAGRVRRRRELARLESYRLRDIGMSDWGRRQECRKWFWQR